MLFVLGSGIWLQTGSASEELDPLEAQELFLHRARVVEVDKNQVGGRTAPWLITLEHGQTRHRAIFKYVDSRRPQAPPDSYKYELAAYQLAKLLHIRVVPPVIEREVSGRKGSLQLFLENCFREKERQRKKIGPPDPRSFADALEEVRIFENLVSDACLDADDIWIERASWKVWRVDFSEAFAPSPELLPECEMRRCPRIFYQALLEVDDRTVAVALQPYLNGAEIRALLQRKKIILEKIKKLIEEKGEGEVLFS